MPQNNREQGTGNREQGKNIQTTELLVLLALSAVILLFGYSIRAILNPLVTYVIAVYLLFPYRNLSLVKRLVWLLTALLIVWAIYTLSGVLSPFLIALALAYIFNPIVDKLEAKLRSRRLALGLSMLCLILVVGLAVFFIIRPAILQVGNLVNGIDEFYKYSAAPWIEAALQKLESSSSPAIKSFFDSVIDDLKSQAPDLAKSASGFLARFFLGFAGRLFSLLSLLVVPVLTFYLLMEFNKVKAYGSRKIEEHSKKELIIKFLKDVDLSMGQFLRGQLTDSLIVSILISIGLTIIGLGEYALIIGVIAGITNIIPYLGPFLGAAPAVMVSIFEPMRLVGVIILFAVVQIVDGSIISPRIMGRQLNMNPVIIMLAVFIGGYIAHAVGMLLAVPAVCVIRAAMRSYQPSAISHQPSAKIGNRQ